MVKFEISTVCMLTAVNNSLTIVKSDAYNCYIWKSCYGCLWIAAIYILTVIIIVKSEKLLCLYFHNWQKYVVTIVKYKEIRVSTS